MSTNTEPRWVCDFSEGSRESRELLGERGASIADLTRVLGADRVPPGFTVTTAACVAFMRAGSTEPDGLADQIASSLDELERRSARRLGDPHAPLLVSVRASARAPIAGMPAVAAQVGLTEETVAGLAAGVSGERAAWDAYRHSLRRFGRLVRGIPGERYDQILTVQRSAAGVAEDAQLDAGALREVSRRFIELYEADAGAPFPRDPREQLRIVVGAVFDAWARERAARHEPVDRAAGSRATAVTVQQVLAGSGPPAVIGVAFSRDELTGAPEPSGRFEGAAIGDLAAANGRVTRPLSELAAQMPQSYAELTEMLRALERHYGDMQDTEFAIAEGRVYLLHARDAKRPAQAMVRFACDAVAEGLLSKEQALKTIDASLLDALLHPTFDPKMRMRVLARGVAASPGAAVGELVFTAQDAIDAAAAGRDVIFARRFADAGDVAGFGVSRGILTSEGGLTSHAAMVARGMGRPAVVGAGALEIDPQAGTIRCEDIVVTAGQRIAIDGGTGIVTLDDVTLLTTRRSEHLDVVLGWADELRAMEVRVNADVPLDAARGLELGAQGIGVCRTEHMFMSADREPKMREMIMARTRSERVAVLEDLRPLQQSDFEGLFEVMGDLPVTIRLLDPPLHEFLPDPLDLFQRMQSAGEASPERKELAEEYAIALRLGEVNPMLGTRGCRLGILRPEIYDMQVDAMMRAAHAVASRTGCHPRLEVMIPLVVYEQELAILRELVVAAAERHGMREGVDYTVGTMIELPRACFVAEGLAAHAEFFSFGTNDLTQTALGFSRDDVEADFVATYLEQGIFERSPFQTLDVESVGELIRMAVARGRARRPGIELGVCGEHGGDPDSIAFFREVGIDYVSCSPYRLPAARVAAAQAEIVMREREAGGTAAAS